MAVHEVLPQLIPQEKFQYSLQRKLSAASYAGRQEFSGLGVLAISWSK